MSSGPLPSKVKFKGIFDYFLRSKNSLKVIHVASCNKNWKPNSAAKMLVDVTAPNEILFLEYRFTQTYANLREVPMVSVSVMDDVEFRGYRLSGACTLVDSGKEYEIARASWQRKLISYEADRIVQRVKGYYSAREAENTLPKDFVLVKLTATEAAITRPDRILRDIHVFSATEK